MPAAYIPATDAAFNDWQNNFADLLTADPTAYGEDAPTAAAVQAVTDDWNAAYALVVDPGTRTPSAVAAKDAARVAAEGTTRPVANRINANDAVTNAQRSDLGLTIRKTTRTPIPQPITAPNLALISAIPSQHKLSIRDTSTPTSKAKPFGVVASRLYAALSTDGGETFGGPMLVNTCTKTPHWQDTSDYTPGDILRYSAEWQTRSGPNGVSQVGPTSGTLDVLVM